MRCPVCKADNTQGPNCRRCKADLSLLFRLERQRERLLATATEYLRAGRFHDAVSLARRAHALRHGADSARLLLLARLFLRDFASVWSQRLRTQ